MNVTDSIFYAIRLPVILTATLASAVMSFVAVYLVVTKPSLCQDGKRLFLVAILLCQFLQQLISSMALLLTFWAGAISQMLCSIYHFLHHWVVFMEYNCLSAMCVDCYLAICLPFRYQSLCHLRNVLRALFGLTALSLGVPLAVLLCWASSAASSRLAGARGSLLWCEGYSLDNELVLIKTLWTALGAVWLLFSTAVIVFCYVMVYREGRKSGLITSSNKKATRTILFQVVQLSLFFIPFLLLLVLMQLPHTLNVKQSTYIAMESANFVVWTVAQLICPAVYAMRSKEIRGAVCTFLGTVKLKMRMSSKTWPV